MLNKEQVAFLKGLDKNFIHGKNILRKKDRHGIEKFFDRYKEFNKSLNKDLKSAVRKLNVYKNFIRGQTEFTSQSKFESTVLEEFICRILKKEFGNGVLQYGGVKAYSSLYFHYTNQESFKNDLKLKLNVKDQDVGIYKKVILKTEDGQAHDIFIPIVCIECKTYLDKTMLEGSVATADKIKNGNPKCLFFIVTERYEVKSDVDIETSQIDNIYVLRKQRRKDRNTSPIQADVFERMIEEIRKTMESSELSVDEMIREKGYLRG